MRKWLNNYFDFSKREFNGLLALMVLILLAGAAPYTCDLIKSDPADDHAEALLIKRIYLANSEAAGYVKEKPLVARYNHRQKFSLFHFDPNKIGVLEWQKLGLSAKQSASVLKFIAKGGRFKKVEDLQKMYTISDEMYGRLAPYVEIEGTTSANTTDFKEVGTTGLINVKEGSIVELNDADSAVLEGIRGIGPVFASRILKYRNRIGGFYEKVQLMEVFGLDSVKYNEIKDQIRIDTNLLKRININTAELGDFKNHPYIRYKQVNAIVEYRKQHGNFVNIADLNKVAILSPETIAHLAPYLTF